MSSKTIERSARAWLVYDIGSSAYALTVGTLFYPIFFARYAGGGTAQSSHWAAAILLSSLLVGVTAPVIGAWADRRGRRNLILISATVLSAAGVLMLPVTATLSLGGAIALFLVVHVAFSIATNVYDSYISLYGYQDANYTARSGAGWALGYVGGLICLGAILLATRGQMPKDARDYWPIFTICALFYLAFSGYAVASLPADVPTVRRHRNAISDALNTLRGWRENRAFFALVLASILINDGITTILFFTSTYAHDELRYSLADTTRLFAIVQGVAIPATWLATRRWLRVPETMLLITCCAIWIGVGAGLVIGPSPGGMNAIALLTGVVVGATPALLRGIFARLILPQQRAELFGFVALATRLGAVVGPVFFLIGLRIGGLPAAMGTTIPAFLIGGLIFLRVSPALQEHVGAASGVERPAAATR